MSYPILETIEQDCKKELLEFIEQAKLERYERQPSRVTKAQTGERIVEGYEKTYVLSGPSPCGWMMVVVKVEEPWKRKQPPEVPLTSGGR